MSTQITKLFKNPLALASAALVIHIGAATAADSTGDIQQQVRDLLTGNTIAHSATRPQPSEGNATDPSVDSQEFVKQLLLGGIASKHSEVAGAQSKTEPQQRPPAPSDMQAAVRKLLLGQPYARDAS
jgi:hypothetical protein